MLTCPPAVQLVAALKTNTVVRRVQAANTKANAVAADAYASLIAANTPLEVLNLESNDISSSAIKVLAAALGTNLHLIELKLTNQRGLVGTDAERALAEAIDKSQTLCRFSLPIRDPGARVTIDRAVSRNSETARKKRFAK